MAIQKMLKKYQIEAISIGNGTASRETNDFIRDVLAGRYDIPSPSSQSSPSRSSSPQVFTVSEDGASFYSASKIARDEFPDEDVTVRGAVSIGRRLMDPLAELVKIDPKSIGVGQYQHDVDQTKLKNSLDQTVESCVNNVGVNLNTASQHLLMYVSGLGPTLAKNIVDYRKENGAFTSRTQLKKVPRLGPAAFQQCAGFLRIPGAKNPLDNSAVHPESYNIVEQMAKDQNCTVSDLINNKDKREAIDIKRYVTAEVGIPTLTDILKELEKPGRDPREQIEEFEFDSRVNTIDDLIEGMELPGIVTNITNFGAFVDIGVHQDGLVHISQMANRRIAHPTDVVKLHQHIRVRVIEVDHRRNRISLSMKGLSNHSGVRSEEEIYMMHQAAYKYCKPEPSIKFDTYHADGRTIVVATIPPSDKCPICAQDEEGKLRAYIRIADENIVASPVHLALWRDAQKPRGAMMTYNDTVRQLLDVMQGRQTLNQIVRLSKLPRPKVITLLARLIRFGTAQWEYTDQQFLFSLT